MHLREYGDEEVEENDVPEEHVDGQEDGGDVVVVRDCLDLVGVAVGVGIQRGVWRTGRNVGHLNSAIIYRYQKS